MLSMSDIKKAVNDKLIHKFKYKIYGNEITQGYKPPCFFVSIFTDSGNQFYRNTVKKNYVVKINFFPDTSCGGALLSMADELQLLFAPKLYVKDRAVTVSSITYEPVGENNDVLQFGLNLSFYDKIPASANSAKTSEPAASLAVSTKINQD